MSDLVDVCVIGEPEGAAQAVARLGELFTLDRLNGPHPSRKTPELVRFYLAGRPQPEATARADTDDRDGWLCSALVQLRERIAAVLEDETADRQYALEQADSSLAALIGRCRAGSGRASAPAPRGGERP